MLRLLRVFVGRYRMRSRYREAASRRPSSVSSYSPEQVSPTQRPVSPSRKVHAVSHPRHPVEHAVVGQLFRIGMWRSLVAHLTGGQGVAGSNPVIQTTNSPIHNALQRRQKRGTFGIIPRFHQGSTARYFRTHKRPAGLGRRRAVAGVRASAPSQGGDLREGGHAVRWKHVAGA